MPTITITPLNTILSWFQTDDFPTELQFANAWSSFWHKNDKLPISSIDGLTQLFQQTASSQAFSTHLNDTSAHAGSLAKLDATNLNAAQVSAWRTKLGVDAIPSNFALIDQGTTFGNVYTKTQSDARYKPITYQETTTFIEDPVLAGSELAIYYTNEANVRQRGVVDLTPFKNDVLASANAGYKGYLKKTDTAPTVVGLYKLIDFGNYPNLTPAIDESGNSTTIITEDGYINEAYYDGNKWIKYSINVGLTIDEFTEPYFLSNPSTSGNSAHDVEFQAVGAERYYFNNTFFTVDKFVTTAKMHSTGAGSITFAFGILDQNNKFIERKALTFTTVAGMNTYTFNELLKQNERIAVKCPITNGMSWINNANNDGLMWETSSYQASATPTASNTIALELNVSDYEQNPLVLRSEFEDLNSSVEILKNKPVTVVGDNGTPYFIKVDNNGNLYAKSAVYQKIAHLGHSFTIHDITPFWWGTYGMAASKRENDYVHRFWDKYKAINPSVLNAAYSVKAWEQMENTSGYNFSQINSTIANADIIFIKVGENISYPSMATFESNLNGLVDYIRGQRPTADIVLIGQIWQNATKEAVLMSVATNKNLIYISMSGVDTPANRAFINDYVLGDDNLLHQIAEGGAIAQGVADHLGDAGHEIVATKLMQGLGF